MCGKIRLVDLVVCYLWPSQIVIALVAKIGGQKSLPWMYISLSLVPRPLSAFNVAR